MTKKQEYNYLLRISYDGTRYLGWQRQKSSEKTIQGKIEAILSIMTGESVEINGSGRTDAGVHAVEQIANFKTGIDLDPLEIRDYLNRYLPEDIGVNRVERAEPRFHARLNAKAKTYCYTINNSGVTDVFCHRFQYFYPAKIDVSRMREDAALMTGRHDFRKCSFAKRTRKSTVRTIYEITISEENGIIQISYRGDGFLYNMVRILTGTLIEVGRGAMKVEEINRLFDPEDETRAGFTAPAGGLTLMNVEY